MLYNNHKKIRAVLVDIDGILTDVGYNVSPEGFKWDEFVQADFYRTPISAGIMLVQGLINMGLFPVFLTARPEFMRAQTEDMLSQYGFTSGRVMYMASNTTAIDADNMYQLNQMMEKERVINENKLLETYSFKYAIDDQELNCELYRRLNIPTIKGMFL